MYKKILVLTLVILFCTNPSLINNSIFASTIVYKNSTLQDSNTNTKHIVSKGDTLYKISKKYNIDITILAINNNISNFNKIFIGQELLIPNNEKANEIKISSAYSNLLSRSSVSNAFVGIWPANGVITSLFGMRNGVLHKGIDIGSSLGTNIFAFANGIVKFSGWNNSGYGNLIIIDHQNGYQTYYAHCNALLVSQGEYVYRGSIIAKVGNTGDSNGCHLHFEIRRNNTPYNPLAYLK